MRLTHVAESLTINAAAADIFTIIANPRQHRLIDGSDSVQNIIAAPQTLTLGATFTVRMRLVVPYTMRNTVVEFDENKLIAWRTRAPVRWRYELEEAGDGTRVTETWDVSRVAPWLRTSYRFAGLPRRTRRAIRLSLLRLKAIAESADLA